MAYQRNHVHLVGNLTADPELKKVGDTCVAKFTVAFNYKDREGKNHAEFFPCEAWGGWAENFCKGASKGSHVSLYGRLKQDTWKDKESGEGRSRMLVRAREVYLVGSVHSSSSETGPHEYKEFTD